MLDQARALKWGKRGTTSALPISQSGQVEPRTTTTAKRPAGSSPSLPGKRQKPWQKEPLIETDLTTATVPNQVIQLQKVLM